MTYRSQEAFAWAACLLLSLSCTRHEGPIRVAHDAIPPAHPQVNHECLGTECGPRDMMAQQIPQETEPIGAAPALDNEKCLGSECGEPNSALPWKPDCHATNGECFGTECRPPDEAHDWTLKNLLLAHSEDHCDRNTASHNDPRHYSPR
jgi:hypothetical protein